MSQFILVIMERDIQVEDYQTRSRLFVDFCRHLLGLINLEYNTNRYPMEFSFKIMSNWEDIGLLIEHAMKAQEMGDVDQSKKFWKHLEASVERLFFDKYQDVDIYITCTEDMVLDALRESICSRGDDLGGIILANQLNKYDVTDPTYQRLCGYSEHVYCLCIKIGFD